VQTVATFRTERLIAERLSADHLGELHRMNQDPRVMATLGGVRPDEETERYLRDNLEHWERYGFGIWAFRNGTDGRFVARAGLRHTRVGGNDEVELAYALRAEYWGRGLATELAVAVVAVGFERLGLQEIVCFTLPTNRASWRVMEKTGFEYERDVVHAGLPHVLYRITASGWKSDTVHRSEIQREEK
jgi:RimJ/RimL family protein N-acetyltransferase